MPGRNRTDPDYLWHMWWPHWRWPLVAMAVVGFLGHLAFRIASDPLAAAELTGSYAPSVPWTLRGAAAFPQAITLDANGWLTVRTSMGTEQRNHWWWDADEGWLRCDLPELDRRIRGYRGWTGPVLYVRCAEPMNRPEEVRLERLD